MANDHNRIEAVRVVFTGRVQGVGFRYTTARLAQEFEIRGWVRNEFDGSVELVAAQDPNLDALLHSLEARMARYIRQIHRQPATLDSDVTGFEIRH
jgi:acylphosphatase